jgi:hypothetical protein
MIAVAVTTKQANVPWLVVVCGTRYVVMGVVLVKRSVYGPPLVGLVYTALCVIPGVILWVQFNCIPCCTCADKNKALVIRSANNVKDFFILLDLVC